MSELKTVSTIDALTEMIESDVFSMHYEPGEKITEADLTSRYAVSRNTVREAIALLLSSGILIKLPNKGVYVRKITIDDIREIFTLRCLLESEAIRSIMDYGIIPSHLFYLAEKIQSINPEQEWTQYISADIGFHKLLVESAYSPRLNRLYDSIIAEVKLCMYQSRSFVPLRPENSSAHLNLLQAMESLNLEEALNILRHHMEQAISSYEAGFKNKGDT